MKHKQNMHVIEVSSIPATNTLPTRIKMYSTWHNEKVVLNQSIKHERDLDTAIAHLESVKGIEIFCHGYNEVKRVYILMALEHHNIK